MMETKQFIHGIKTVSFPKQNFITTISQLRS